ncbi:lopap-like [Rhipicephalus sanguineus]|uniref:lopap-like n=1 Tax=Rhipicephalus sanguineus TaxID=34632 RepID=UPI0018952529|nr:lopap-like [Rhipicephalus sanguineus]
MGRACGSSAVVWLAMLLEATAVCAMVMPGLCPTLKEKDEFDLHRFMGTWYEVLRTPFIIEYMVKCVRFHCLDKGEENSVGLKVLGERSPVAAVFTTGDRGDGLSIDGEILTRDANSPYGIRLKGASFHYASPMIVLDTDYDNYAVLWACENNIISGIVRRENIWVLSRSPTLNATMQNFIMDHLKKQTYSTYFLMPTEQKTCKGHPVRENAAAKGSNGE